MAISTPVTWTVDRFMEYDPSPQILHPSAIGVNLALSGTISVGGVATFSNLMNGVSLDLSFGLNVGSGAGSTLVNGTINVSNGSTGQVLGYDGSTWSGMRIGGSAVAFALSGTDILTLSPTGTNHLRPNTDNSVNLGIASTNRYKYIYGMGLVIGGTDTPLTGQIKLGTSGVAGYLSFYDGSYVIGHIDASELFLEIGGTEALKVLSSSDVRIINNKLFKARNAANNADLDLIGRNSSDALILGNGLTGVLKVVSSVVSAAGILNADVQSGALITPDKLSGPLFSYYRNASDNNVTGNGTVYTCLFDTATVSNANYNTGTGIFTAPAAGKYLFVGKVGVASGSSGGTQGEVNVVTTGRSYRHDFNPYGNRHNASGVSSMPFAIVASMAASDTAKVTLTVIGDGSNIADFIGGAFSDFACWRVG